MALIQMGNIITDIRGKIQGTVFSRNIAGNTMRNKTVPKIYTSEWASVYKQRQQFLMRFWRTLTDSERQTWVEGRTNYTFTNKLGNSITPQANVLFAQLNFNKSIFSSDIIRECPEPEVLSVITDLRFEFVNNSWQLIIDVDKSDTNEYVLLYGSKPVSITQIAKGLSNLKLIGGEPLNSEQLILNVQAYYLARLNLVFARNKCLIAVKIVNERTGQSSPLRTIFWDVDYF